MIHVLPALLLSLALALTSHSAAVAKGSPMAVGQMVICTGFGATVLYTDADGQPTSAPHLCPDCVMQAGVAIVPDAGAAVGLVTAFKRLARPQVQDRTGSPDGPSFLARGPPVTI